VDKQIRESVSIRMLDSIEELTQVRNLEHLIWADDDPVPVNHSSAVVKNGGMVIGAFMAGELIGFQYSFAGFDGSSVYLYSHSLGIHPDYRRLGIGEQLKRKQKEAALQNGYDRIVWTYDPLETVNGYLNLNKLGGTCARYLENCYGEMPDVLNAGLPSDRLLVEWRIAGEDPWLTERMKELQVRSSEIPDLIQVGFDSEGYPLPLSVTHVEGENAQFLRVPVPSQFQAIKSYKMELACEWRMKSREAFMRYLNKRWIVAALHKSGFPSLFYYILIKK
jgi:predicted GNAT superfamily acetyltransferase